MKHRCNLRSGHAKMHAEVRAGEKAGSTRSILKEKSGWSRDVVQEGENEYGKSERGELRVTCAIPHVLWDGEVRYHRIAGKADSDL